MLLLAARIAASKTCPPKQVSAGWPTHVVCDSISWSGCGCGRPNWTLPRLANQIEKCSCVRISRSRLSMLLHQKGFPLAPAAPSPEGPPGYTSCGSR
jgi:hypothetical protein